MPLPPGTKLGPYEILEPIGAGGMGEVYRARDPRLGRDVAIKCSSEQFTERFEREARAIAALNHPHICHLYDVGSNYLVMELVEGSPLKGPLPLDQALKYAAQICDALDAAHKKGITHRDLKPANILVSKSGIKLLDFGLAKIRQQAPPLANATLTMALTGKNEIVGTLAYMSPEQLQSAEGDGRSDIFSFGSVLFEMLTGKSAFKGASAASVIAAIMERPAPSVANAAPATLDRVLKKCFEKDPDERWQSARDLKIALLWASESLTEGLHARSRSAWWAISAAILVLTTAALGIALWGPWRVREAPKPLRFQIALPHGMNNIGSFVVSPDGTKLAYFGSAADSTVRLWVRAMDTLESSAVAGTEGVLSPFFWSPDSRFIVFSAGGKLKKVDVAGGAPQTLCDVIGAVVSGSWNRDGVIIFGLNSGAGIQRVSSAGGVASPVTALNSARGDSVHLFPVFLPDGRHFLYLIDSSPGHRGIYVGSLDLKPEQQDSKLLLASDFGAAWVPLPEGKGGAILFERNGTLLSQGFDVRRLKLAGDAIPIAEQVGSFRSAGFFSTSENGILAYRGGAAGGNAQLAWFDRQGKSLATPGPAHDYLGPRALALSPDGARAAAARVDDKNTDIWLTVFSRGSDTRLTFDAASDRFPVWSPDGGRIAFSSNRGGGYNLYQHASNGAGPDELLFRSDHTLYPTDWSQDGRLLMFSELDPKTNVDLWVVPVDGRPGERKPLPFLRTEFLERDGKFSPDARWVAYESNELGRSEIYVRPFPASEAGGKWMISQGGGREARWRGDGKEVFYLAPDGSVMAVPVASSGSVFQPGTPSALFKTRPNPAGWDVTADGTKFLFTVPAGDTAEAPLTIVLNWTSLLKK